MLDPPFEPRAEMNKKSGQGMHFSPAKNHPFIPMHNEQ